MSFEEKFDIEIPTHKAAEFVTVGDAIAFINAHIAGNRPSLWPSVGLPQPVVRALS
jgi:hypothetical protein